MEENKLGRENVKFLQLAMTDHIFVPFLAHFSFNYFYLDKAIHFCNYLLDFNLLVEGVSECVLGSCQFKPITKKCVGHKKAETEHFFFKRSLLH